MKKRVSIIGGGTAALFFAAHIDSTKYEVTLFEKNGSLGRKFLVAGDGGFNLTHAENMNSFIDRYTPNSFLKEALCSFTNDNLRTFLSSIEIPTFIGSSNRVYPEKNIKPIQVLNALLKHIENKGVILKTGYAFKGWNSENHLLFNNNEAINSDINVFSLGGASWKVTGSDGSWLNTFSKKGITTHPFQAANCGFQVEWEDLFINQFEGTPLKNIEIQCDNRNQKGEAVITKFGLEGNAIYGLSPSIQKQLNNKASAEIFIDFKPSWGIDKIESILASTSGKMTHILKTQIKLPSSVIALLKTNTSKDEFMNIALLCEFIKKFPLELASSAPIDEAISTSGGITIEALTAKFELNTLKNNYCIGEMVEWNAPTGGYLIQGCASMGVFLARYFNDQK